ncbi:unnamed protein product [Heligmosomoides polygyrus]|uniref:Alpha,alpha-trehalase n=1 Tax=Heligmosomoides polygyrus TaxID=6339 RepID=A0A183F6V9_HELPZ|nr:unnamed protein product [Heligmosomoides polygyrus]
MMRRKIQEHCAWTQYLAGHHMLLAHAHAYRSYHGLFTETKGKVGMANSVSWAEADDGASAEFVDEVRQWFVGWFTHPLFEDDPSEMEAVSHSRFYNLLYSRGLKTEFG